MKSCNEISNFSNAQLVKLAYVKNDSLRETLIERAKETEWGSRTIAKKATAFNKLIDYLDEHTPTENLKKNVLESLLMNYPYPLASANKRRKMKLKPKPKNPLLHGT